MLSFVNGGVVRLSYIKTVVDIFSMEVVESKFLQI